MPHLSARSLIKSDTPDNRSFGMVLVIGTAGSLVIEKEGGNIETLPAVPINVWIPVGNATNIRTASTADGFLVA